MQCISSNIFAICTVDMNTSTNFVILILLCLYFIFLIEILQNTDGRDPVPVVAYNPLGWLVRRLMPVNVTSPNVSVVDIHGRNVGSQVCAHGQLIRRSST